MMWSFPSFLSGHNNLHVQIDLVIDRADGIVTICEMKYPRMIILLAKRSIETSSVVWKPSKRKQDTKGVFK